MVSLVCLFVILCFISLSVAINTTDPDPMCYFCHTPGCNPPGSLKVRCMSNLCFILHSDITNTYRGCFEPGRSMHKECEDKRFTSCHVCKGSLCNDWSSLISSGEFSCLKCAKGECSATSRKPPFVRCPYFMYPDLPRCYSLVDKFTNEYTFGCANEMTVEQRRICEKDWFQSVCKYCDTMNCNTQFFRKDSPLNLLCFAGSKREKIIFCKSENNASPYYGCYSSVFSKIEDYGCLSDLYNSTDDEYYMALFTGTDVEHSIFVCFTNECNTKFDPSKERVTACGNLFCPTAERGSSECAIYDILNTQKDQLEYRCMGRYPCWRGDECQSPCNSDPPATLGKNCPNPYMNCFTCVDCPTVSVSSPFQRRSCDLKTNKCVTMLFEGVIVRGCYESDLKAACVKAGDDCDTCRTSGCNNQIFEVICHACTSLNPQCAYEQENTFVERCPAWKKTGLYSINRCFIRVTKMNEVRRGCLDPSEPCNDEEDDYKNCIVCDDNLCNSKPVVEASCVECHGNITSACANDIPFLISKDNTVKCPVGYSRPHCYTAVRDGQVERGCVSSRSYEILKFSCNSYETCFFCDAENCNYFQVFKEMFRRDKKKHVKGGN